MYAFFSCNPREQSLRPCCWLLLLCASSLLAAANAGASTEPAPAGEATAPDYVAAAHAQSISSHQVPYYPLWVGDLSQGCSYDLDSEYSLLWTDPEFGYDAPTLVEFGDHDYSELSDTRCAGQPAVRIDMRSRLYLPIGPGPFPLVLILHGQQSDFDLPGYLGYGWLAGPLARRGYAVASIDGRSLLDSTIKSRGEHLREHLRRFAALNAPGSGSPLEGTLDLSAVVLVGHSRGGDAITAAWEWQRVSPDPQYHIAALLAIAPVQFFGAHEGEPEFITHLRDVAYQIIQGSKDGDVSDFQGLRQYDRAAFPSAPGLTTRSMVYLKDANHNSFNSIWTNEVGDDYCCGGTLEPELARKVAAVYMIPFIEYTLTGSPTARALLSGDLANPVENTQVSLDFQEAEPYTHPIEEGELEKPPDPLVTTSGGRLSASPPEAEQALTQLWIHDWALPPYGSYRGETVVESLTWEGELTLTYTLTDPLRDAIAVAEEPCISLRFAELADTSPETAELSTHLDGLTLMLEDQDGIQSEPMGLASQLVPTQTWENLEAGPRSVMTQLRLCLDASQTDPLQSVDLDRLNAIHFWLSIRKECTLVFDDVRITH